MEKVGNRHHWEDWANDIAKIARTHIDRIRGILENPGNKHERETFQSFAAEIRDDLNDAITDDDIIEMLAQHLITQPVFAALFEGYDFAAHNPISRAMSGILEALQQHRLDKETDTLQGFYDSVKLRAQGIDNAAAKQKIVVELYDKFFRNAFPKTTERLGIVYTPVEVVDFIIHSVEHILQTEFDASLADPGVHYLDPFTGTGTFLTRLLTSGIIPTEKLPQKYLHELHANELVLLAYYIAAINIEATYHGVTGSDYQSFPGICLTDTFQLYEKDDLISKLLVDNSDRRIRQKELDIKVIVGNPPYSAGQTSANDNNQNVAYPDLDERIRTTYADRSTATNKNALYDSYIRAIRWASDRIGTSGIIGFVTNAGFLEANTADGLRQCLAEEFSNIYVFHLRGNQRTSGELSRKEGGKIFGSGSRAPIAITFLVKNPDSKDHGKILWHDIGDYLSQSEKLEIVQNFHDLSGITQAKKWKTITPDEHGDWVDQRDDSFDQFIEIGNKKNKSAKMIFENYSRGLETGRDAWIYYSSKSLLNETLVPMIDFYNAEADKVKTEFPNRSTTELCKLLDDIINVDPTKISWTRGLKQNLTRNKTFKFQKDSVFPSVYRKHPSVHHYFSIDRFDFVRMCRGCCAQAA